MLIYLARLDILEAFSTEFQTASESDKKKITKYLIDHIRNPLRELASKIVIEDETAEKKAHLDYEQSSPIKYGQFIFERNSRWGERVYDLAVSEPGCLVEEYGLERFTRALKVFPKDVSELSNSAKDKLGRKFMNSIGGQNNKGKKHTKQQNEAKSERMKGHTIKNRYNNKLKGEKLEFAMKYGVLYAEFETEAGGGSKIVQFKQKYPEFKFGASFAVKYAKRARAEGKVQQKVKKQKVKK